MKISKLTLAICAITLSASVSAEKPEWAGKGKPTAEQRELHVEAMKQKEKELDEDKVHSEEKDREHKEHKNEMAKKERSQDRAEKADAERASQKEQSMAKQREKKSAMQSEATEKGSAKGKAAEDNGKKWWKFWGEE